MNVNIEFDNYKFKLNTINSVLTPNIINLSGAPSDTYTRNEIDTMIRFITGRIDDTQGMIAESYQAGNTYYKGDIITYDDHLYMCLSVNSSTSFNPTEWSQITILDILESIVEGEKEVYYDSTANWNAKSDLVSKEGVIYIYSDYTTFEGVDIPGIKIGDGNAYLIDIPFFSIKWDDHINDQVRHITQAEREFWNNKVRTENEVSGETLIFTIH